MRELKIVSFDSCVAFQGDTIFVQAYTEDGTICPMRFPVSVMPTLHQVLDALQTMGCPRPGTFAAEFLEPIVDLAQGAALLRFVGERGERGCVGVNAESIPSLKRAIAGLPWSRCEIPETYGNA